MPAIAATFDERIKLWIELPSNYPMSPPIIDVLNDLNDPVSIYQQDAVQKRARLMCADWSPAMMSAGVLLLTLYCDQEEN
jgi:ubiquitin-protein ligase